MRRKAACSILAGVILVCSVFGLTGCGTGKLSDKFQEDIVKEKAEEAIGYFNEHDYQSILDMGSPEMKDSITEEEFAEAGDPYLEKCGAFETYAKEIVTGTTDPKTDAEYAILVAIGDYEGGKIQFTVGFDVDMQLIQFLIK